VAINAPAAVVPIRTIHNIALNPNFGGEVMVIGLGCEKLQPERLLQGTEDVKAIPVTMPVLSACRMSIMSVSNRWSTTFFRLQNAIWIN
jgi:altronate dehydratase